MGLAPARDILPTTSRDGRNASRGIASPHNGPLPCGWRAGNRYAGGLIAFSSGNNLRNLRENYRTAHDVSPQPTLAALVLYLRHASHSLLLPIDWIIERRIRFIVLCGRTSFSHTPQAWHPVKVWIAGGKESQ